MHGVLFAAASRAAADMLRAAGKAGSRLLVRIFVQPRKFGRRVGSAAMRQVHDDNVGEVFAEHLDRESDRLDWRGAVGHGSALVSRPLDFKRHRGPTLRSPALEPCGQLVQLRRPAVRGLRAAISPLPLHVPHG
jgi:hypothetical protein